MVLQTVTDAAMLDSARRAYVIAAAGCGKTHLIADAVECAPDHRQLILTHTNAGVDALRRRLAGRGIPDRRAHVETISGFAQRYAAAYPKTCQIDVTQPSGVEWRDVQHGATRFFATRAGRAVITDSYGGLYVDEYQDCTQIQHALIRELADVLPTRILGDPMQAIFDFAGEPLVNFDDFDDDFERLDDLTYPWRWASTNPQLGEWLLYARRCLLAGKDPNFHSAPLDARRAGNVARMVCTPEQVNACKDYGGEDSVVAIRRLQHAAHETASKLRGVFTSMEEMDCRELFAAASKLDRTAGAARALVILDFSTKCMTKVSTYLGATRKAINSGKTPVTRGGKAEAATRALMRAAGEDTPINLLSALREMAKLPDVVLYRAELYEEMCRTMCGAESAPGQSYEDLAWAVRDQTRRRGRAVRGRVVSRTLLVKGLEFDHAIVLDYAELNSPKEKYVALTRPRRSLTVLLR
jgi:UvrD/REP helicase N-terminal domain